MSSIFFWVVIGALAAVETAIIVTALRMRVTPDPARGILGARGTEVLWTLLPIVLLAAVALLSFQFLGSTISFRFLGSAPLAQPLASL